MNVRKWMCLALVVVLSAGSLRADDWPQWMGPNRDGVWNETGLLERFPAEGLKLLWRTPIRGGYAGPAVAAGRVYVMDFVSSADLKKLAVPSRPEEAVKGTERVLCLDARTGKQLWKYEYPCSYTVSYPAGPRCTPTVQGNKVYTLGTEGNLFCFDASRGTVLWSKDFQKDYGSKTPIWGFCGHPLVDGQKLICTVGGKNALLVAFDKDTGKELWKSLDAEEPGYCPPSIITAAGKRQLLLWDPEKINSVDPETGQLYWSVELKPAYAMSIMAPRQQGEYLFAGGIGFKSVLLRLTADKPGAEVVYRGGRNNSIYPVNSTPLIEGDTLYGVDQPGALRAIDLKTGKRLWETYQPTTGTGQANSGTAFLVKNGDRYLIFAETGHLILAKLSRTGYEEISRQKLLEPTGTAFGRSVVWSHPAFAERCVFARNDREIVCYSLAK